MFTRTDCEARAAGMVSVQVGCSTDEALALIDARAIETNQGCKEIARNAVDRLNRFAPVV